MKITLFQLKNRLDNGGKIEEYCRDSEVSTGSVFVVTSESRRASFIFQNPLIKDK